MTIMVETGPGGCSHCTAGSAAPSAGAGCPGSSTRSGSATPSPTTAATATAATAEATWLRLYPDARLEVLPDAGHYPMFESPVRPAALLESFLDE